MALSIQKFSFNGFQENTYIVQDGINCVIIDPGCYEKHEQDELMAYITTNNLKPAALLLTHAHIDHVLGCAFVLSKFDIDFYLHKEDLQTLNSVSDYASVYGYPVYLAPPAPNKALNHGDYLSFGEINLEVKFTPGHSTGHVVFYNQEAGFVINGDVLFAGSFGRTDLPGGDIEILKNSIHNIMFKLPEETVVYCGHGGETTIGQEKSTNYILQF
jgi:hydroxyacylglutathione hydrolase